MLWMGYFTVYTQTSVLSRPQRSANAQVIKIDDDDSLGSGRVGDDAKGTTNKGGSAEDHQRASTMLELQAML